MCNCSPSRRTAFGALGAGAVTTTLAACGGPSGGEGAEEDPGTPSPAPETGEVLTSTGDVPVGGGTVLEEHQVVVTQPEEGTFRAFSTACTHEGCPVDAVEDGQIVCPCHDSRFSVADGAPEDGPAQAPLEEFEVTVEGDDVVFA
ncbi:Rieske (2Fe-2S) protein [Nocardiopsis sp. HNM0947]|uniref:Cytochrome bc1 complex Rieske iron-sulfur subunit n=1 Tax=Nocardiopsis coralli TaxID=2772213 RepID=A0ABR9PDX9_9ACTN|nr:Rieske (2Fe-2S) protein [Nocardiopsis coralli]MBE3002031.1 Rieske (2Fe-2S) protein [Nocardiopsis coralli]